MATNVWGVPPAPAKSDWADSVDQDEAANGGQLPELPTMAAPLGGDSAFPSLGEALKPAPKKKGRNKGTTLALSEFQAGSAAPPKPAFRSAAAAASRDKEKNIMANLPKGPRERDASEERDKLGGGFQDYSGARARGGRRRDDDDDEAGPPRRMEDLGPSKADESADWGADRKPQSSFGGGGFGDRDRAPRTSGFGGDSAAADSAESWGSRRPAGASAAPPRRAGGAFGGFDRDEPMAAGGGFVPSDRPPRRAGGFEDMGGSSRADEESRWGSKFTPGEPRRAPSAGADEASSWASRRAPSSTGDAPAAGPASRPRLNLKPRTAALAETPSQPDDGPQQEGSSVKSGDGDTDGDAPAAAAPSAPRSNPFGNAKPRDERLLAPARNEPNCEAEPEAAAAPAAAPAPRSNPFGAARPREEVLREQGRTAPDAAAPRPETPEEADLRQKIEGLKLRVQEGEGEAEIQVPALSSSTSQPNGQAKPALSPSQPAEPVSGKEAADMAKQAVQQASSDQPSTSSSAQDGATESEPRNGSAASASASAPPLPAAAETSAAPPKVANAWAKKPSLQLQTTVQEYLAECEGKLKQLSTRLDAEARETPQSSAPAVPASRPAASRW